jgi:hypothetical protein
MTPMAVGDCGFNPSMKRIDESAQRVYLTRITLSNLTNRIYQ